MSGTVYSSAIGQFLVGLSPVQGAITPPIPELPDPDAGLSTDIIRMLDDIQLTLQGITLPVIQNALWSCIQEFCIRSTYYRAFVHWQMAPGQGMVDFNPFSDYQYVVWITDVKGLYNYRVNPPAQLVDLNTPLAPRHGDALLVLRPIAFEQTELGDPTRWPELFTTWFETMMDGVLYRLYSMPSRPWSNPQLVQYHGPRFRMGINRARDIAERLHSSQQSPFRMYPYFARGRRKN